MATFRKDTHRRKMRLKLAGDTAPPALGHQACGAHGLEVVHAAQSVFAAAMYNSLGLDRLAVSEGLRFQQDCVVTGAAKAVEAPKSGGTPAEHQNV
jgi:hypothetical protein